MSPVEAFHPLPLLHPDYVRDPHPTLAAARRDCPVFHAPDQNVWIVTRHEDVKRVLQDVAFRILSRLDVHWPTGSANERT